MRSSPSTSTNRSLCVIGADGGPSSANATGNPSRRRAATASRGPVTKSHPGRAPARVAYSRRTSGVSRVGSTLNETSRTPSSSRWRRANRPVSAGQTSGQCVKTKSAIQTWPARSWARSASPPRSVRAKDGTVPRTGRLSCRQPAADTSRTAVSNETRRRRTRASRVRAARRRRDVSVMRFSLRGGRRGLGERTGDAAEVRQEREDEEHAEDGRRQRDVGQRPSLDGEVHVEEGHERRLGGREQNEHAADGQV